MEMKSNETRGGKPIINHLSLSPVGQEQKKKERLSLVRHAQMNPVQVTQPTMNVKHGDRKENPVPPMHRKIGDVPQPISSLPNHHQANNLYAGANQE